jgi:hypothetical protein
MTTINQLRSRVRTKDSSTVLKTNTEGDRRVEFNRGDGPHVRGCWVVDLVLGKE